MCRRNLTLILPTGISRDQSKASRKLGEWGVRLLTDNQRQNGMTEACGLLVEGSESSLPAYREQIEHYAKANRMTENAPFLVLIPGDGEWVSSGLADRLHQEYAAHHVEVVRLLFMENGERAIIGGSVEGYWVTFLRRLAARHRVISLVCRRAEVDEMAFQHRRYLLQKQRFFLEMANRCEAHSLRLEVIAQGLGMDERIGQEWLCRDTSIDRMIPVGQGEGADCQNWLEMNMQQHISDFVPAHVLICGKKHQIDRLSAWIQKHNRQIQTSVYVVENQEKTNESPAWTDRSSGFTLMLEQADLLVIAAWDNVLQELDLQQIKQRMRQPVVLDAVSLFPRQEADLHQITYMTYGQNTNVRNENYTERR
ncbi:MAG: hypothetical protein ACM32O_01185 [Clostridia bacterium]